MKAIAQILLSLVIILLSYFIPREQFFVFISLFIVGFASNIYLFKRVGKEKEVFYLGLFLRLVTLFSIPLMSDDYFRFLWDGAVSLQGVNPLEMTPEEFKKTNVLSPYLKSLFEGMNSRTYFTVYPPLNQGVFYLANLLSGGSVLGGVVIIRLFLVLSEVFVYKGIIKLLKRLKVDSKWSAFYWLNPMIIMELSGNLHMESIMIAGFLWTSIFLNEKKLILAALALAISVNGKFHTLMFIPLILSFIGGKDFIKFIFIFSLVMLISVIPFVSLDFLLNLSQSLNLYFQSFEFNASVFYLIRELGYLFKGYDLIRSVGPILSITSVIVIIVITFKSKVVDLQDFIKRSMLVFLVFLLLGNTIHPWYVSLYLVLSILNNRYVGFVWSFLILLTYFTYHSASYDESLWLVLIEYLVVFAFLIYERKFFTVSPDTL